jgi:hypothetical protein
MQTSLRLNLHHTIQSRSQVHTSNQRIVVQAASLLVIGPHRPTDQYQTLASLHGLGLLVYLTVVCQVHTDCMLYEMVQLAEPGPLLPRTMLTVLRTIVMPVLNVPRLAAVLTVIGHETCKHID